MPLAAGFLEDREEGQGLRQGFFGWCRACELHDIDPEMVMDALEAARLDWRGRDDLACEHFRWRLLGGKWTGEHKGVAYDSFEASARGLFVRQWCSDWHLNREASFAIGVYGEEGGFTLCTAWCHKMQWLFNRSLASGHEDVDFSAAVLTTYEEPAAVAELYRVGGGRVRMRIDSLRALAPVR